MQRSAALLAAACRGDSAPRERCDSCLIRGLGTHRAGFRSALRRDTGTSSVLDGAFDSSDVAATAQWCWWRAIHGDRHCSVVFSRDRW